MQKTLFRAWLSVGLLLCLAVACDRQLTVLSSSTPGTCDPASRYRTQTTPWNASFGHPTHKGAWACLQLRQTTTNNPPDTIAVFVTIGGLVRSWNQATSSYDAAPTFVYSGPTNATERTYRLFVLRPEAVVGSDAASRLVAHQKACASIGTDAYDCYAGDNRQTCWFALSFDASTRDGQLQVGGCKLLDDPLLVSNEPHREGEAGGSEQSPETDAGTEFTADVSTTKETPGDGLAPESQKCELSIDCPSGFICSVDKVCLKGECDPRAPPSCPTGKVCSQNQCVLLGCVSDTDCPDNAYCSNAECTPKRCGFGSRRCDLDSICVDFLCTKRTVCNKIEDCSSSKEECIQFFNSDTHGYCTVGCGSDGDCPGGLTCELAGTLQKRYCFQPADRNPGETCRPPDHNCAGPFECTRENDKDTNGTCLQTCRDVRTSSDCPAKHLCVPTDTTAVCVPWGTRKLGDECSPISDTCVDGLPCITMQSLGKKICVNACDPKASPMGCASGEKCFERNGHPEVGVCLRIVTRKLGETCGASEYECEGVLMCVKLSTDAQEVCRLPCTSDGDCQSVGKKCADPSTGGNQRFCIP